MPLHNSINCLVIRQSEASNHKPLPNADELKNYQRIFVVGSEIEFLSTTSQKLQTLAAGNTTYQIIPIGIYENDQHRLELEEVAWFLVRSEQEALPFIEYECTQAFIGFIVLAYNEENLIRKTLLDIQRFANLYAPNYQILVVNDGSTDKTVNNIEALKIPQLIIHHHTHNLGMGAGMYTGYLQAKADFLVMLPADRQVRAQSLISYLPHLAEKMVVLSRYEHAHSGKQRALMSIIFRLLVRWVGGLTVTDFAGAYIFPKQLLTQCDLNKNCSKSFLFTFELLECFKKIGCRFHWVVIHPFMRDQGHSKEANLQRIFRMFREIILSRLRRL
jgi:hypothetical protein